MVCELSESCQESYWRVYKHSTSALNRQCKLQICLINHNFWESNVAPCMLSIMNKMITSILLYRCLFGSSWREKWPRSNAHFRRLLIKYMIAHHIICHLSAVAATWYRFPFLYFNQSGLVRNLDIRVPAKNENISLVNNQTVHTNTFWRTSATEYKWKI